MVDGTRPVEIVCGVNLPMLIKLATCDRSGLRPAEVAELVKEVGKRSIRLGSELTGKFAIPSGRSPLAMARAEREVQIRNRLGMHARAAVKFVQTANGFKSEVKVVKDGQEANGKSIMGLLTLVAAHGVTMTVVCEGDDADGGGRGAGRARGHGLRRRGRSRDGAPGSGWARRPGIAIGVAHVLGEPRRDPRAPHRRRAGRRRARSASRRRCSRPTRSWRASRQQIAEREGDEQQYRILEAHRLMLSDVHLVERARRDDPRRQGRGRVGGAQGARPDPGGVRAHRGSRTSAIARATSRWSASACCATWSASATRRRPRRRPRGASPSRTSCRRPTPRSWGARRPPASAPRAAGAPRTRRSWRARWGCPTSCGVEGLGHKVWSGMTLVIDGVRGEVILDPDAEALRRYEARAEVQRGRARSGWRRSATCRARPPTAPRSTCAANIEMLEEIPIAVELGAESVGLFRTEFLYLERHRPAVGGRAVRARGRGAQERGRAAPSPSARWTWAATSCRRRCASRAAPTRRWGCGRSATRSSARTCSAPSCARCYRAAAVGPMQILFPLISGVAELRAAKRLCAEVARRAEARGHAARAPRCRWA